MYYIYYPDGRRKSIDLNDLYANEAVFLICGAPSVKNENLKLLQKRGVVTLTMNNAGEMVKSNLWVGGDKPECYSKRILMDPSILKFVNMGKRDMLVGDVPWKLMPATVFYPCSEQFSEANFLNYDRDLVWWKNTFFIALQLSWRLGFRTVYLLGAEFRIDENNQYAWKTTLEKDEIEWNKRLYARSIEQMKIMKPLFEEKCFNVYNCSKNSALVDDFGYIPLKEAVEKVIVQVPTEVDTTKLPHSSKVGQKDEKY